MKKAIPDHFLRNIRSSETMSHVEAAFDGLLTRTSKGAPMLDTPNADDGPFAYFDHDDLFAVHMRGRERWFGDLYFEEPLEPGDPGYDDTMSPGIIQIRAREIPVVLDPIRGVLVVAPNLGGESVGERIAAAVAYSREVREEVSLWLAAFVHTDVPVEAIGTLVLLTHVPVTGAPIPDGFDLRCLAGREDLPHLNAAVDMAFDARSLPPKWTPPNYAELCEKVRADGYWLGNVADDFGSDLPVWAIPSH